MNARCTARIPGSEGTQTSASEGNRCVLHPNHVGKHMTPDRMLFISALPINKTPSDLLTDEFIERMLEDVKHAIPKDNMNRPTQEAWFRRLLREKLLERLAS